MDSKNVYKGFLKHEFFNAGSKSEHRAVVLDTGDGKTMKLNVKGLNPFSDPLLEAYVGRHVEIKGVLKEGPMPQLTVDTIYDIAIVKAPKL